MAKDPKFINNRTSQDNNDTFDDTITLSDFKFNKKATTPQTKVTKDKKAYDFQADNIENTTVFKQPKKQPVKKVSPTTLTVDDIKKAEAERKARLEALLNKKQEVPSVKDTKLSKLQIQQAIENKNKAASKDPKIVSGTRKPLKPKYNQDYGQEHNGIQRVNATKEQARKVVNESLDKVEPLKKVKEKRQSIKASSKHSNNNDNKVKKKKRNKLIRRAIAAVFLLFFLSAALLAGYLFYIRQTAQPLHLTVIGVDQRSGQLDSEVRADAIMSINVGTQDNRIILGSIPRDTLTYIPCVGYNDKINHAYVFGAMYWQDRGGSIACLVDSVQNLVTSPSTQKYAKVNFANMVGIVNAIGGIDLTPTATFCEMDSNDRRNQHCFTQGEKVHMNGEMALAYSRHRKSDDDIQRGLRQQEVIRAMASRVQHINILEWPAVFTRVAAMIDTNLSFTELLQIALVYATRGDIQDFRFDWSGTMINGIAFVVLEPHSVQDFSNQINNLR